MDIKPSDRILDLVVGTGRNSCLMGNYLSSNREIIGYLSSNREIIGLDISNEMINQFKKECKKYSNVKISNKRIDLPLDYEK